jgi:hypothetical protein
VPYENHRFVAIVQEPGDVVDVRVEVDVAERLRLGPEPGEGDGLRSMPTITQRLRERLEVPTPVARTGYENERGYVGRFPTFSRA